MNICLFAHQKPLLAHLETLIQQFWKLTSNTNKAGCVYLYIAGSLINWHNGFLHVEIKPSASCMLNKQAL